MKLIRLLPILLTLFFLSGCQKKAEFAQSFPSLEEYSEYEEFFSGITKITLYSTKSLPYQTDDSPVPKNLYHGYEVLGSLEIIDKKIISELLKAMKDNIYDGSDNPETKCFDPRHGLRMESEGKIKDFQLCFECSHLYIFDDVNSDDYIRIGLKMPSDKSYFNKLLDDNGILRETTEESK